MRYIELNPMRAGMAIYPSDYPWSSYRDRTKNMQRVDLNERKRIRGNYKILGFVTSAHP
jgi:hypothetical protein